MTDQTVLRDSVPAAQAEPFRSRAGGTLPQPLAPFRAGARVMLRSPADILATLDDTGSLDGLPFMPEMLQYFGRVLTVAERVVKICDTICPIGSRRMHGTVFLEELRCDGTGHGGCEAECRLYWKEAWVAPAEATAPPPAIDADALAMLARVAHAHAQRGSGDETIFRCQATEARHASEPLNPFDPRPYVAEVTCGNVPVSRLARVGALAAGDIVRRTVRFGGRRLGIMARTRMAALAAGRRERGDVLNLRPGEWVEVKSAAEIARTLDRNLKHRGMLFAESEMLPACGKRFQVRRRVNRIIDEPTGKMIVLKNDCIVLEGFVCTGDVSRARRLCARRIFPYWREAWLRRVDGPAA